MGFTTWEELNVEFQKSKFGPRYEENHQEAGIKFNFSWNQLLFCILGILIEG